jgi:hypothetical protein
MLGVFLAGCTTWRPTTVSPKQVIEEEQPSSVRVTQTDGTLLVLSNPSIVNDSIVTVVEERVCQTSVAGGRFNCVEAQARMLIALDEVASLELRRVSPGLTLFVVAVPLAVLLWFATCDYEGYGLCAS